MLGVLEAEEATPVDELAFEGGDPGFGHGVFEGVSLGFELREVVGAEVGNQVALE